MSLNQEAVNHAKIAEAYVINSEDLDDDYKNTLLTLLATSTMATNGITPEQKIQKMTECIQDLAISQVGLIKHIKDVIVSSMSEYTKDIDQKITNAVNAANTKQCDGCKAMKHANDVEKQEHDQKLIAEYKKKMGIKEGNQQHVKYTWDEILKDMIRKPWVYIILGLISISPHGVEIIKLILNFCSK